MPGPMIFKRVKKPPKYFLKNYIYYGQSVRFMSLFPREADTHRGQFGDKGKQLLKAYLEANPQHIVLCTGTPEELFDYAVENKNREQVIAIVGTYPGLLKKMYEGKTIIGFFHQRGLTDIASTLEDLYPAVSLISTALSNPTDHTKLLGTPNNAINTAINNGLYTLAVELLSRAGIKPYVNLRFELTQIPEKNILCERSVARTLEKALKKYPPYDHKSIRALQKDLRSRRFEQYDPKMIRNMMRNIGERYLGSGRTQSAEDAEKLIELAKNEEEPLSNILRDFFKNYQTIILQQKGKFGSTLFYFFSMLTNSQNLTADQVNQFIDNLIEEAPRPATPPPYDATESEGKSEKTLTKEIEAEEEESSGGLFNQCETVPDPLYRGEDANSKRYFYCDKYGVGSNFYNPLIDQFLKDNPKHILQYDLGWRTKLNYVFKHDSPEMMSYWIEQYAKEGGVYRTLRQLLAKKGHRKLTKYLMSLNELPGSMGDTALHTAIKDGRLKSAKYLITIWRVKLNISNTYGDTPLHTAIKERMLEFAMHLIAIDRVKLNVPDKNGDTPLHTAIKKGYLEIANKLIGKGADVTPINNDGESVLHLALKKVKLDLAISILEQPNCDKLFNLELSVEGAPKDLAASSPTPLSLATKCKKDLEKSLAAGRKKGTARNNEYYGNTEARNTEAIKEIDEIIRSIIKFNEAGLRSLLSDIARTHEEKIPNKAKLITGVLENAELDMVGVLKSVNLIRAHSKIGLAGIMVSPIAPTKKELSEKAKELSKIIPAGLRTAGLFAPKKSRLQDEVSNDLSRMFDLLMGNKNPSKKDIEKFYKDLPKGKGKQAKPPTPRKASVAPAYESEEPPEYKNDDAGPSAPPEKREPSAPAKDGEPSTPPKNQDQARKDR